MPRGTVRPFEDVYMEHFSYVYNLIYMHVLDRETAEDLTSDTFTRALAAYDRYDPALASERTWLCTIANRLLINHYRARASHKEDCVGDEALTAIPSQDAELLRLTEGADQTAYLLLSSLDEEERRLLLLRYYQGWKNPEIAAELGISANAVSERYRRLLAKCRKLLEGPLRDNL